MDQGAKSVDAFGTVVKLRPHDAASYSNLGAAVSRKAPNRCACEILSTF